MDAARAATSLVFDERFATRDEVKRSVWTTPFEPDDHYDLSWDTSLHTPTAPRERYFSASLGNTEVARVLIVETHTTRIDAAFHLPSLPPTVTEIEWIEVARGHRRVGIGMAVVRWLEQRFADEHLIAFGAVEAEQFWDATGWNRFERRAMTVTTGHQLHGKHSASPRPLHLRAPVG